MTVALVGYLESISMAKAFARKNGYEARRRPDQPTDDACRYRPHKSWWPWAR